jgi:hypothetical protein
MCIDSVVERTGTTINVVIDRIGEHVKVKVHMRAIAIAFHVLTLFALGCAGDGKARIEWDGAPSDSKEVAK